MLLELPPLPPEDFRLSAEVLRIEIGDDVLDTFDEDGLYALTFEQVRKVFPQAVGLPLNALRLFTGPADTLPQNVQASPSDSLSPDQIAAHRWREVPLQVRDGGNGTFDEGDTLVFWAQGTSRWRASVPGTPEAYRFVTNPFSLKRSYFLDLSGELPGKPARIETWQDPDSRHAQVTERIIDQGWVYARAQSDRLTFFCDPSGKLDTEAGYVWYWHWRSDCKSAQFPPPLELSPGDLARPHLQKLPGITSDSLYVVFDFPQSDLNFHQGSLSENHLTALWGGQALVAPESAPAFALDHRILVRRAWFPADSATRPEIRLAWTGSLRGLSGYDIRYRASYPHLRPPYVIFPHDTLAHNYALAANQGGYAVITADGLGLSWRSLPASGLLATPPLRSGMLVHTTPALRSLQTAQLSAFAMVPDPPRDIDYLIVAPEAFLSGVQKLAEYRGSKAGGSHQVGILAIENVFARFAGGRPEPAALRDYLRHAKGTWGAATLKHVLLLGDGHYDVRNVGRHSSANGKVQIPPFILFDHRGYSQSADDRYVFFGDSLGLSLGRLPLASLAEIDGYLAKAKSYDDPKQGGAWRGRLLWTADDAFQRGSNVQNDGLETSFRHTDDVDFVYHSVKNQSLRWHHSKILMTQYAANAVHRKPEAAQDLVDQWNRGALAITYFGHGAYNQWADEGLAYTHDLLPRLRNAGRLPMVNSFSCTVGRFENGLDDVLTERIVRMPDGGAIAGVAATRETYVDNNRSIAKAFYAHLLREDSLGGPLPAGEALRRAKNQIGSRWVSDHSSYVLLGEPVLRVGWRGLQVGLDFSQAPSGRPDTLRALQCGTISGTVTGSNIPGDAQGHVQVTVNAGVTPKIWEYPYDRQADGTFNSIHVLKAEMPGKVLFSGGAPFARGRFSIDYVMPLQIPFGDSMATLLVQAFDTTAARMGGAVHYPIRLDGVAVSQGASGQRTSGSCATQDDKRGPRITLMGCDDQEMALDDLPNEFSITLPYCLRLRIVDSLGGVLSSESPDEGTVVSIPGSIDPYHPIPGIDEPMQKEYRIALAKSHLRQGEHALVISAGDAYGNRSFKTYRMRIAQDTLVEMLAAFNVPNPMKRFGTTFHFAASVPADDGEFAIDPDIQRLYFNLRIYDQIGRKVAAFDSIPSPTFFWDGRSAFGTRLANGIYTYAASAIYNPGDGFPARVLRSGRKVLVISR